MVNLNQSERDLVAKMLTESNLYSLRFRQAVDEMIDKVFHIPAIDLTPLEMSYCRENQKINAIRELRNRTNISLINAKNIIERYMIANGYMKDPSIPF